MRVLILSVGGSCEPVVNAIKEYRPDYVYFLCSGGPRGSERAVDGPGDPCGDPRKARCSSCGAENPLGNPQGKAIVLQTALKPEQYEKIPLEDPDDLDECYTKVSQLASSLSEEYPGDLQVIANYTGGTKTMSVALAMVAAMTEKWDLSLNKGARLDLIKVASGTDVPIVIDKWQVFCRMQMEAVRDCLRRFDYAAADGILSQLSSRPIGHTFQDKVIRARQIARAFDLWDKFDHERALPLLEAAGGDFSKYIISLKKLLGRLRSATGYERVSDLVLNAQRRAEQRRYDDAVARLYRAAELMAQLRLKARPEKLDSGSLRLEQLPASLQGQYASRAGEDGRIMLGLKENYELLQKLGDTTGAVYAKEKLTILNALKRRNESIYAHGLTPMTEEDYREVSDILSAFISELSDSIGLRLEFLQLPTEEILTSLGISE